MGMKEEVMGLAEEVEATVGGCVRCIADKPGGRCLSEDTFECSDAICREVAKRLRAIVEHGAEDVSVSAYDLLPEDEREAIAWVREHGGLENCAGNLRRFEKSVSEDSCLRMAVGDLLGINAFKVLDMDVYDLAGSLKELDKRLMPAGMEWPRFEDGEMLQWNDEYANGSGNASPLHHVSLYADGRAMLGKGKTKVVLAPGQRVKRPAPKVVDADGVEIKPGDMVWAVGDALTSMRVLDVKPSDDPDEPEHLVWCGETWGESLNYAKKWRIAGQLTHEYPDTWERIEEDARLMPSEYTDRYRVGRIGFEEEDMRVDLVRRCRALAERGEK